MARPALPLSSLAPLLALTFTTTAGCTEPAASTARNDASGDESGSTAAPLAESPEERRLAVKAAMILRVVEEVEKVREGLGEDAARAEILNQRFEALKARVGPARAEAVIAAVRSAQASEPPSTEPASGPLSNLERLTRLEETATDLLGPETLLPDDSAAVTELKRAVIDQQENLGSVLGASRLAKKALEHVEELARVVEALEREAGRPAPEPPAP